MFSPGGVETGRKLGFPGGASGKLPMQTRVTWVQSLDWDDPLEEGMATHSCVLAWRIPWMKEPGGPWGVYGVAKSWT